MVERSTTCARAGAVVSTARSASMAIRMTRPPPLGRVPVRPDRAGYALEGAGHELVDQEPRRIDRARHAGASARDSLEAELAVERLVAHQHHQAVALAARFLQ